MKRIGIVLTVVVLLLIAGNPLLPRLSWDGMDRLAIRVRVVDRASGAPVPEAEVRLVSRPRDGAEATVRQVVTDDDGEARIEQMFPAGGGKRLFYDTISFCLDGCSIRCEKEGYTPLLIPVERFGRRSFYRRLVFVPRTPTVRMDLQLSAEENEP